MYRTCLVHDWVLRIIRLTCLSGSASQNITLLFERTGHYMNVPGLTGCIMLNIMKTAKDELRIICKEAGTSLHKKPTLPWGMVSSGMIRRGALVRTDVSEEHNVRWLLVTDNVVPRSPIFVTLVVEEPSSSKTSTLTRASRRNIPEDVIFQSPPWEPQILHNLVWSVKVNWKFFLYLIN
jgi:hypothetical protein